MYAARDLFADSQVAREAFGQDVVDHYLNRGQGRARRVRGGRDRLGEVPRLRAALSACVRWASEPSRNRNLQCHRGRQVDGLGGALQHLAAHLLGGRAGGRRPRRGAAARRRHGRWSPTRRSTCSTGWCSPAAPTSTRAPTAPSPHAADREHLARARPLRARPDPPGARARAAGAGHLPRDAAAERGARRDDRPARARRGGPPRPPRRFRAPSPTTRCGSTPTRWRRAWWAPSRRP